MNAERLLKSQGYCRLLKPQGNKVMICAYAELVSYALSPESEFSIEGVIMQFKE